MIVVTNIERMRMLLNGNEMGESSYVIPTSVLQRLLDAAATARYVRLLCVFLLSLEAICSLTCQI